LTGGGEPKQPHEAGRTRSPTVAVVGRPNVGKSTLVNRLAGRRKAIAHETAGVTRDRVEVRAEWQGRSFDLVDTGGYVRRPKGIEEDIARQAARAADTADLVLFVVDASVGIADEDETLARQLQRSSRPVLVVANKVDSEAQEPLAAEFHALGLGEPLSVSALHGRMSVELLDRIADLIPEQPEPQVEEEALFALVGRPNVGKSSLFNRLVREERAVVHETAGTTRDTVDSIVRVDGRDLRFVDTAGLRPVVKTQGIEYYGLVRSIRAIDESHVALVVVDASEGVTGEDKRIAARVVEAGRGLVVALNKWDLVPSEEREDQFLDFKRALEVFPGTPVLRTSALTGLGVGKLVPALLEVRAAWLKRVPTAEVNRVLERALAATPPPLRTGRIHYATQTSAGPPTFVLFGGRPPDPSYRRYLENTLRREFGFAGVPVRLSFRGGGRGRAGGDKSKVSRNQPRRKSSATKGAKDANAAKAPRSVRVRRPGR
jgi:GTP-binding protein